VLQLTHPLIVSARRTAFIASCRVTSLRVLFRPAVISCTLHCRNAQNDPSDKGSPPQTDPHPEEQTREGARELHRLGGEDRRQRGRIRERQGVDEDLFRAARTSEGGGWFGDLILCVT